MPKGMREVFELSRKQYLSHKEIATALDMSEEASTSRLNVHSGNLGLNWDWQPGYWFANSTHCPHLKKGL
jgi:hypothetical protein